MVRLDGYYDNGSKSPYDVRFGIDAIVANRRLPIVKIRFPSGRSKTVRPVRGRPRRR